MLEAAHCVTDLRSGLREGWEELKKARPGLRQRDAAAMLGVSEGELVASREGSHVMRLAAQWKPLLAMIGDLGPVKTITRNEHVVHETTGVWSGLSFVGNIALVQSEGLDLRLLLDHWEAGFLVGDPTGEGIRGSVQFYDRHGDAVLKIYPTEKKDWPSLTAAACRFGERSSTAPSFAAPASPRPMPRPPAPAARQALLEDWEKLRDTHDFGAMLGRHGFDRAAALEAAEGRFTTALPVAGVGTLLDSVAASGVPMMTFVGNRGCVQIRTAPVSSVRRLGPWLNILDEDFNLHLLEENVDRVWSVRKPTSDGVVTSVEAYARDGGEIVVFYGARKPGIAERADWRELVHGLSPAGEA
jgi:putative hemin transport protein